MFRDKVFAMTKRALRALMVLMLLAGAGAFHAAAADSETSQLTLTLRPVTQAGAINALEIETQIAGDAIDEIESLSIYEDFGPLLRIGERISQLTASDAEGAIALESAVTVATETPFTISRREWALSRPPQGELAYTYTAHVSLETATGPVWELRSEPDGVSGSGQGFLVLPESERLFAIRVRWDLSELGDKARALTSFSSPEERPQPLSTLQTTFFMAGELVSNPESLDAKSPFKAASTTTGAIDQTELLDWTKRAYDAFNDFFNAPEPPPFTVFIRRNPFNGSGGTAFPGAFVATMSEDTKFADMRFLIAHEMAHVFLRDLGVDGAWFNEGLAVHYQRRLPLTAGLVEPHDFLADVNDTARRYYANVRNDLPMAEAQDLFWIDARGRILPYDRGTLYFAETDAKLKDATNGAGGLDDVVREMIERRRKGGATDLDGFLSLLARDLGDEARADYDAMMAGALIVPPSDAFGPCFRRVRTPAPSFELGFAISSLMQTPRIISGLDPASPAAKAGLREGDRVTNSMVIDSIQASPSDPLTLVVEREGENVEITFKPEGAPVEGYKWVRNEDAPDDVCRRDAQSSSY